MVAAVAAFTLACEDEKSTATAPSAHSAAPPPSAAPAPTPTPSAAAPPPSATSTGPVHDCPAGSSGDATFAKPCEAKGNARMMEVTWTGKMTDGGPSFKVVNKSPSVILYGMVYVYFYDKAGKQLEVKDASGKAKPFKTCGGDIFGGVLKPAEKATMDNFSCVKKDIVPDGFATIEAEAQMVGFADKTEKKNEYYWKNPDLTPDARPKGGVKK